MVEGKIKEMEADMAYFPFMIDIGDRKCLVVGGGNIALHKVKILLRFGVKIYVVAPFFVEDFRKISEHGSQILLWERQFSDRDIDGMDFVIAATDEEQVNLHVSALCKEKGVLINVVDQKEACSFLFPAMLQEKDVLVAISSGGNSPASVSYLKKKIKKSIPDYYGGLVERLGEFRQKILQEVDSAGRRKELFYKLLSYGDAHNGEIPESVARRLIEESKSKKEGMSFEGKD